MSEQRTLGTVVKLPRSGRPAKVSPEAQPKIIQTITKDRPKNCRLLTAQRLWCHNQKEHQEEHKRLSIICQEAPVWFQVLWEGVQWSWSCLLQELEDLNAAQYQMMKMKQSWMMWNTRACLYENGSKEAQRPVFNPETWLLLNFLRD